MTTRNQINLSEYISDCDFNDPEIIEEMEIIAKQIEDILQGMQIDESKMLTTFNVKSFCQKLPRIGSTMYMLYKDFVLYGIVYGIIATKTQQP